MHIAGWEPARSSPTAYATETDYGVVLADRVVWLPVGMLGERFGQLTDAQRDRVVDQIVAVLQTRAYAETLIRNETAADTPEEQIEKGIELRMTRQQMLGGEAPADFAAVVDESVLRRVIGGPEVMRDQLTKLLVVAERPNVEVRVLPLGRGAHAGLDGAFSLFEMPDPYPDVATVDTLGGAIYVEEDAAVDRFRQAYHQLSAMALGGKAGPLHDGSGRVAVRHSHHRDGAVIVYTRAEWEAFTAGVRLGEFDFTD